MPEADSNVPEDTITRMTPEPLKAKNMSTDDLKRHLLMSSGIMAVISCLCVLPVVFEALSDKSSNNGVRISELLLVYMLMVCLPFIIPCVGVCAGTTDSQQVTFAFFLLSLVLIVSTIWSLFWESLLLGRLLFMGSIFYFLKSIFTVCVLPCCQLFVACFAALRSNQLLTARLPARNVVMPQMEMTTAMVQPQATV